MKPLQISYHEAIERKSEWFIKPGSICNKAQKVGKHEKGFIYFLLLGNKIVYVGQTMRISTRINNHIKSDKKFNRVYYFEVSTNMLDPIERYYIDLLKPKYNKFLPVIPMFDDIKKDYGYSDEFIQSWRERFGRNMIEFINFDHWAAKKYPRRVFKRSAIKKEAINEYCEDHLSA